jgi:hypothetical protein
MKRGLSISVASLGTLAIALPAVASAATPVSQAFTTPGEQQFVVPPGVNSVQVELIGGYGGSGNEGIPGGIPATATATLTVSPGETLYAEVAGNGQSATGTENKGGYGGGAAGAARTFLFASAATGGGGGGASDVRTCPAHASPSECGGRSSLASRLLVGGGGGGGGGNGLHPATTAGGDGGSADQPGAAGAHDTGTDAGGGGGLRATATAGGAAGFSGLCNPSTGSGCAAKGELGQGGEGGEPNGGGGGGGIFGGGGGGGGGLTLITSPADELANGGGGGGGGGSSGLIPGATGVSNFSLVPTATEAQPSVTFTWTPSAPAAVTGTPSTVTAATASLDGTVNPSAWQILSCAFEISPAPAGVSMFPCAQQLSAGITPVPVSATAAGLAPSTAYTVTLVAASVQGTGSGLPVTFVTSATSGSGTGIGPAGTGASDGALTVMNLKLSPSRFRRGTRAATITRKPKKTKAVPTLTTISFTLSSAATAKLSFELAQPGVLVGRKCGAVSKAHRKGKHCTRYTAVHGGVSRVGHAGTDKITFAGVLDGGARLAPGAYRLSVGATGPAGSATAAQHPSFTLLD